MLKLFSKVYDIIPEVVNMSLIMKIAEQPPIGNPFICYMVELIACHEKKSRRVDTTLQPLRASGLSATTVLLGTSRADRLVTASPSP